MTRKLDALWCWTCDRETAHEIVETDGGILLRCEACGRTGLLAGSAPPAAGAVRAACRDRG